MATKTQRPRKAKKPATTYAWKPGVRMAVRADVAATAIEEIRARDGSVTPTAVVEDARDPDHPLHRCFVWDDSEAAERYRQQQARLLVNSIRVVVLKDDRPQQQTAWISVDVRETGKGYLPASVVMSDDDYRSQALAEALSALQGWRRRYGHLKELADVFEAIDRKTGKAA